MEGLLLRDVDSILPFVNEFGRSQMITTLLFCLTVIGTGYHTMIIYFVAANPSWKCAHKSSICIMEGLHSKGDALYGYRCNISRKEWVYAYPKTFSIVTEFDLVCDSEYLIQLTVFITFLGWAVGAVLWSWLSDMYGRLKVFAFCIICSIVVTFVSAFSPAFWFFAITRFITGFVAPGTLLQMFVLQSEYVSGGYRPFNGIILWFSFAVSLLLLCGKAYALQDWSKLSIVASAPYIVCLLILFYVPESFRFQHMTGKNEKAMATLSKIAKRNGKVMPNIHLPVVQRHKVHHFLLFKGKKIRKRSIIQLCAWVVNGLVYYGASLGIEQLPGHFYRDYALSVAVEIPAALLAIYGCSKVGRKWTVAVPMFAAGVFCITVSAFARYQTKEVYVALRLIFLLFAKCAISVSFDALYTWSIELFPTVIRSQGLAVVQASSRFGMALIPWMSSGLRKIHPVLPFSMVGLLSFASAVSLMWLPETRGAKTAESLADEEYEIKPGTGGTAFSNLADQSMSLDDFHL